MADDLGRLPDGLAEPEDDGVAAHLAGMLVPDIRLQATDRRLLSLAAMAGRGVVYVYPMTGRPDVALPDGWDEIPGARGCTPQSCAFRDHYRELVDAGANYVFGLSVQDRAYQREAHERLHLPFLLLSDHGLELSDALGLPRFSAAGMTLLKRLTMIIDAGRIEHVFYPVFPPDRNAADVLQWLRDHRK